MMKMHAMWAVSMRSPTCAFYIMSLILGHCHSICHVAINWILMPSCTDNMAQEIWHLWLAKVWLCKSAIEPVLSSVLKLVLHQQSSSEHVQSAPCTLPRVWQGVFTNQGWPRAVGNFVGATPRRSLKQICYKILFSRGRPNMSRYFLGVPFLSSFVGPCSEQSPKLEGVTPNFLWTTLGCSPPTIGPYQPIHVGVSPYFRSSPPLPKCSGSLPGDSRRDVKPCFARAQNTTWSPWRSIPGLWQSWGAPCVLLESWKRPDSMIVLKVNQDNLFQIIFKTSFTTLWKVASALVSPKHMTVNTETPQGVPHFQRLKAVLGMSDSDLVITRV